MSVRSRYLLTAISALLWSVWVPLVVLAESPSHQSTTLELVAEDVIRVGAILCTLTTILFYAISPFIATARIYMRIGELEERSRQSDEHECTCQERQVVGCAVIPIRPLRHDVFSDS